MSRTREPLDANDFPVESRETAVTTRTGKPVAQTPDPALAEEIADRLNEHEQQRQDDSWTL
jgi:hypothetical protein